MKTSFSHIRADLRQAIEHVVARHLEKLEKLLKADFSFSLNLALPTGTLHATGIAPDAPSSVRVAFAELEAQLKKHKEKLRRDYEWKRKRPRELPGTDRT
jgi:ribosome-associated translation inhibitor RaiA